MRARPVKVGDLSGMKFGRLTVISEAARHQNSRKWHCSCACGEKRLVFVYYGARGVTVCDRWNESFANFLADMGECPQGMWPRSAPKTCGQGIHFYLTREEAEAH